MLQRQQNYGMGVRESELLQLLTFLQHVFTEDSKLLSLIGLVSSASTPLLNHLCWNFASVIRLSNVGHGIDEGSGDVEPPAKLTGGIVLWECVVVVVEAFTHCPEGDYHVLCRVDTLVIGPHAPHVGCTVDQPGSIEPHHIAKNGAQVEGVPQTLTPEVPWHPGRHHEANKHH